MATAVRPTVFKNLINGEWVESSSGLAFEDRNPANTRELVGMFPRSTAEDVDAAVRAAAEAFQSWRLVPAPKRAEIMYRAAETLVKRKDDLARDMTREMGKVLAEARGDVQEAIDMTYYMAGEGRRLFGQTTPSELPNKFAMSARQPHGRLRPDHAMEFPDGYTLVEDNAGAGVRKHGRNQAGRRHASLDLQFGSNTRGSRRSPRRRECREWNRAGGGCAAR